jgi:hypothetical protein
LLPITISVRARRISADRRSERPARDGFVRTSG